SVERDEIGINLSAHEVRQSITVDEIPTLSRQRENEMARNFGWTPYWEYPMFPITNAWMRPEVVPDEEPEHPQSRWLAHAEPHLRSYQEVRGYRIQTADKRWGFLNDLMIRSLTWVVRF